MIEKNTKTKDAALWILDLIVNVVIIFGLVIIIQTWIIAPFDVSGGSMCNTLNMIEDKCVGGYGEKIIINEATYLINDPERGDIVVFKVHDGEDEEEKFYIKRIIGLPGDTIKVESGEVYLKKADSQNYIMLDETYLNESNKGKTKTYFKNLTIFEVPADKYFVLGDNRKASTDSRSCFQHTLSSNNCENNIDAAFVAEKDIRGKASIVWWPLANMRVIEKMTYSELQ